LFQSTDPSSTNFLRLSSASPCVDTGCPADPVPPDGGLIVDMGAIEYLYSPSLSITKSVTNVTLGGSSNTAIPGATITYSIYCTNSGLGRGLNIVLYDAIATNMTFYTSTTLSGWTNQWATNKTPDQSYDSPDYLDTMPDVTNVRWVRWKNPVLSYYTAGVLYFKVTIK
ncbi:MAG: hypothetical protein JW827_08880, partial [Spirochaetes bacterium]|nr:hypothetical protein [Spirochaetota bacterium]